MKHLEAYLYEKYNEAYGNTKPGQQYPDYWPSYVVDAFKAYAKAISPAIGGEAVPRTSETPGPEASPSNSLEINVEALEKEGWEIDRLDPNCPAAIKGVVVVEFTPTGIAVHIMNNDGYIAYCQGVKTMQDLNTLTRLVNGE